MAGKFEVYKDNAGKYRFRLKAGNGEIIAVGEAYESKSSVSCEITTGDAFMKCEAGRRPTD